MLLEFGVAFLGSRTAFTGLQKVFIEGVGALATERKLATRTPMRSVYPETPKPLN